MKYLYPLSEKAPHLVGSRTGVSLSDLTTEAVIEGRVQARDVTISRDALNHQAEIARGAGRTTNARNLERAGELVSVPQALLLDTYEMLRPGRATGPDQLLERARQFRTDYDAIHIAELLEEAAGIYERRGIFRKRY